MRKFILLFPLLLMPVLAGAAHTTPLQGAAYALTVSASRLHNDVARLRGNRRLKMEARQFAILSDRFARRARFEARPPRLARSLVRLERAYGELHFAFEHARVGRQGPRLYKRLRKVGRVLNRLENRVWSRGRLAASRSQSGYFLAVERFAGPRATVRRYRE